MSCPPFDRITCGEVLRMKLEVFLQLVDHDDSALISCSEGHLQKTPLLRHGRDVHLTWVKLMTRTLSNKGLGF